MLEAGITGKRGAPRVSVVMSVYNECNYVRRAIDSMLAQTFQDFEFVIVDDGSTDGTADIIGEYKDPRIRLFRQANQGLERSLNDGISLSRGTYVARMDADDISRRDRLDLQVSFLDERPSCGLVGSYCIVQWDDEPTQHHVRVPLTDRAIRRRIYWENPFVHSSVMMRRSVLARAGLYKPEYRWGDYELWCRIIQVCEAANLPDELVIRTLRQSGHYRVRKSLHYSEKLRVQMSAPAWQSVPVQARMGAALTRLALTIHRCGEALLKAFKP
jgi:glycosyltransferase involved in cell wall biosynthesis